MPQANVFIAADTITFDTVQAEHKRLHRFIGSLNDADFFVDLSEIRQCDSAGLALMIEARRLANLADKKCQYLAVPESVLNLASFCGIASIFS